MRDSIGVSIRETDWGELMEEPCGRSVSGRAKCEEIVGCDIAVSFDRSSFVGETNIDLERSLG
jgi:hypothetical protein